MNVRAPCATRQFNHVSTIADKGHNGSNLGDGIRIDGKSSAKRNRASRRHLNHETVAKVKVTAGQCIIAIGTDEHKGCLGYIDVHAS